MTALSFTWVAWMLSTVALYWLLPARVRGLALALGTLIFLASVDWRSAVILLVLTVFTYAAAELRVRHRYTIGIAIIVVVGLMVNYKLRVSTDMADAIRDVGIPLGLSYYCFRIISYLIERGRNALQPHNFADYAAFLFFLPTILVGPINRFREFHTARHSQVWSAANLSWGGERILVGYFKITVLGNFLLSTVFAGFIADLGPELRPLALYLDIVRGALTLYMMFSGYSDIAIGFARMMGFPIIENFNWPFLKKTIPEFWRSWHMSLTGWSREYIFMRVVGYTRNPIIATLCSLVVIGIWHELSVRFIVWGLFHGVGIAASNEYQKWDRKRKGLKAAPRAVTAAKFAPLDLLKIFGTANWFFFGYNIVHHPTLGQALEVYHIILFSWWS